MAYLTVEGRRRVYYEDHGAGDCALVLIHGWGMDGRVWDGVLMSLLAGDRRVMVMAHRGCGRSDHDFPDLGIAAIAGGVARLSQLPADYPMISDIHFWAQFPGEGVESGNRRLHYIAENVLPRLRAAAA